MKPSRLKNRTATISASRWTAYAAAGAATAITGASSAEAGIHYSGPLNVVVPAQESLAHSFALDNNAVIRFANIASGTSSSPGSGGVALFRLQGASVSNLFRGSAVGGFRYPDNVASGQAISAGAFQAFNGNFFATLAYGNGFANSKFVTPGIGYIGFRFNGGFGMEFGWARVNMDGAKSNGFTVVDYAWADSGTAIAAGQTSAVPEPSSLALLALGAAGLGFWRKRRTQAAAQNS